MYVNFHLQGWGDHTDVLQAVAMYILAAGSVCLYCWIANELSEQVRKIMFSNQTCIYVCPYFHKSKYNFRYVTCNIRNIPVDIRQVFVADIICKRSEHSISES